MTTELDIGKVVAAVLLKKVGCLSDIPHQGYKVYDEGGLCPTIVADRGGYGAPLVIVEVTTKMVIGNIYESRSQAGRVYSTDDIAPTLDTATGGNRMPLTIEKYGSIQAGNYVGTNQIYGTGRLSPTLRARDYKDPVKVVNTTDNYRIRKLTPKECWRLMGFNDEEFEKAEKTNSNSQLYKQAGNSIVVDVLMHLFTELQKQYPEIIR